MQIPWVDPNICVGTTACVEACPKVFRLNEEGKSEAYNPAGDTTEKIQEAIDSCPVAAIKWVTK